MMILEKNSQQNFDASTPSFASSVTNLLIEKGLGLYAQYIDPKLTQENMVNVVAGSVSFSAYYGAVPTVAQSDQAVFVKRAGIAIGFKVFNILATPVIAQFVDSFAEVNINNAKYTYHSIKCIFQPQDCSEPSKFTGSVNLIDDVTQFDVGSYAQSLKEAFGKLSLEGLLLNGMISATASDIQESSFVATGFDQYCQNNFCKDYASYYYKEGVDNQIKTMLSTSTEQNIDQFNFVSYVEQNHPEIFPALDKAINNLTFNDFSLEKLATMTGVSLNFEQICQNDLCESRIVYSMIDSDKNESAISSITVGQKIHADEVIHLDSNLPHAHFKETSDLLAVMFLNQTCPLQVPPSLESDFL